MIKCVTLHNTSMRRSQIYDFENKEIIWTYKIGCYALVLEKTSQNKFSKHWT